MANKYLSLDGMSYLCRIIKNKFDLKADKTEIPTSLKNPNALNFTSNGQLILSYDGSEAKSIEIINVNSIEY